MVGSRTRALVVKEKGETVVDILVAPLVEASPNTIALR